MHRLSKTIRCSPCRSVTLPLLPLVCDFLAPGLGISPKGEFVSPPMHGIGIDGEGYLIWNKAAQAFFLLWAGHLFTRGPTAHIHETRNRRSLDIFNH